MDYNDYLKIQKFINDCPVCKLDLIGTDEMTGEFHGSLELKDSIVTRKCKCGFEITVDSKNGVAKGELKKRIEVALNKYQIDYK